MNAVNVKSEIDPLKSVLLHRPGNELLNLTPDTLEELLFDDIPYLKIAQEEHDAFAQVLRDNGVEVYYLEDLMAEVLEDAQVKEQFVKQFIAEAGIATKKWQDLLFSFLVDNYSDNKELVLKTMEGINLDEIPVDKSNSLVDLVSEPSKMIVAPLPNLYFTRDPFAMMGTGVSLNKMYSVTRNRETIYGEYILKYHPMFEDTPLYYERHNPFSIEGGDILNLSEEVVVIGISQRTQPDAIDMISKNIFASDAKVHTVLAFDIPATRAFMHLDTVFTQIDYDKFTIHPGILGPLTVFEITPGNGEELNVKQIDSQLEDILETYLGRKIELILCGGGRRIAAEREQWNDGSNTLCIAPGKIVVYERNDVTNNILRDRGLEVIEIPSAELSRGRGGPRCMSMPLWREA